jgi:3-hydroxyisobutyrate dehydrogenase-like beta-hydroxyacid dehydrogenase
VKVAIVGCGEVGRAYAAAAAATGYEVVLIDPCPAAAALTLGDQLGVAINPSPGACVGDVDRLWICVAGDLVTTVCSSLIGELPVDAIVVDMTTASAEDKRSCAATLSEHGLAYVDVVIMGSVSTTGPRTALLAAGDRAETALSDFAAFGAPVKAMSGGKPGDAAAVKLLRTILTKGLETLAVECFMAAEMQGLRSALYEQLGDFDATGFVGFLEMLVTSHVQHAGRRMHEVQRAQTQLAEIGCPSLVLAGSEARFAVTIDALNESRPEPSAGDIDGAVAWLVQSSRTSAEIET